ncbi:uncharacterized protein LOC143021155 [Oratosquilla oratoria]|uniref:uncharacterized protein LOC143021155 n=1 Tax=Oratosquilla oratoria TaxID=337810 RepID=UPI003F766409
MTSHQCSTAKRADPHQKVRNYRCQLLNPVLVANDSYRLSQVVLQCYKLLRVSKSAYFPIKALPSSMEYSGSEAASCLEQDLMISDIDDDISVNHWPDLSSPTSTPHHPPITTQHDTYQSTSLSSTKRRAEDTSTFAAGECQLPAAKTIKGTSSFHHNTKVDRLAKEACRLPRRRGDGRPLSLPCYLNRVRSAALLPEQRRRDTERPFSVTITHYESVCRHKYTYRRRGLMVRRHNVSARLRLG